MATKNNKFLSEEEYHTARIAYYKSETFRKLCMSRAERKRWEENAFVPLINNESQVWNKEDNIIFGSIDEAAEYYNTTVEDIESRCQNPLLLH